MAETKTNTLNQSGAGGGTIVPRAATAPPEENKPRSSTIRRVVIIVVVIVAAIVVWKVFFATPKLPASIVALSGRVEGDDSAVAPKTSGKILEVTVREGDTVTVGQVIARLDDAQVRAKEDAARAALADAQAKSRAASDQIATLQEQLIQNKQQTEQSKTD